MAIAVLGTAWPKVPPVAQLPFASGRIGAFLPGAEFGWSWAAHEVADTAEMRWAVGELLHYDDAVFRSYSKAGRRFDIYIAYWKPGKIPTKDVEAHTPDICWVSNGWEMKKAFSPWRLSGILAGQNRVFATHSQNMNVIFWHVVDGKVLNYQTGDSVAWWATFSDVWRDGTRLKPEQVFIRLSSEASFEQLQREPMFQRVMAKLAELGLKDS